MNKLITAIHGFCMSLADSVPGVSGGTVAFLMGFYDNFIKCSRQPDNRLMGGTQESLFLSDKSGNRLDNRLPYGGGCAVKPV